MTLRHLLAAVSMLPLLWVVVTAFGAWRFYEGHSEGRALFEWDAKEVLAWLHRDEGAVYLGSAHGHLVYLRVRLLSAGCMVVGFVLGVIAAGALLA